MRKSVEDYVSTCSLCQIHKYSNKKPAGLMKSSPIGAPWQSIYLDLMGPYPGVYKYLLVIVDKFTKWVELFPLRNSRSQLIINRLEHQVFTRYGYPLTLTSDNGKNLIGKLMAALCSRWNIKHITTSPYHPQSNLTERINRNLKPMISSFVHDVPHNRWAEYIDFFALALRTALHESTGFTPSKLMFNRELRLPVNNVLDPPSIHTETEGALQLTEEGEDPEEVVDPHLFDQNHEVYKEILEYAKRKMERAQLRQKLYYDKTRREFTFNVGDIVIIQTFTLSNKSKGITSGFSPKYRGPARVMEILSPLNYKLVSMDGSTSIGNFHISQLRPYKLREGELPSPSLMTDPPSQTLVTADTDDDSTTIGTPVIRDSELLLDRINTYLLPFIDYRDDSYRDLDVNSENNENNSISNDDVNNFTISSPSFTNNSDSLSPQPNALPSQVNSSKTSPITAAPSLELQVSPSNRARRNQRIDYAALASGKGLVYKNQRTQIL